MNNSTFGIIITCYAGDYFLTKGLLASISLFMPHIPICIIKDGDFSIEAERKIYNISHVITKSEVKDDFLRENCFGSRCTNMIAFWESPFEYFFYIDSDTVAWGDVTKNIEYWKYDFIHNLPHEEYSEFVIKQQYFNFDKLFKHIPSIDVYKHHFFNAGVFIAKRGIFDLECYKDLFRLWNTDKKLFGPEPQGFINYMVFLLVEQNKVKVAEMPIQDLVPMFNRNSLENNFTDRENAQEKATIIHWAGMKPLFINREKVFANPSLEFRKQNLKDKRSILFFLWKICFFLEENKMLLRKHFNGSFGRYVTSKLIQIYTLKIRNRINNIKDVVNCKSIDSKRNSLVKSKETNDFPTVLSEDETIQRLLIQNMSIACFDLDSFRLSFDCSVNNQIKDKEIRYRFRNILQQTQNNHCFIAIPPCNLDTKNTDQINFWYRNKKYLLEILAIDKQYYASLISFTTIAAIWKHRNVVLVFEHDIDKKIFEKAQTIIPLLYADKKYWIDYNPIQRTVINTVSAVENPLVIIMLPIISPILAYDLSKLGIQTIDFYSIYSTQKGVC